jgi:hypothetical protein
VKNCEDENTEFIYSYVEQANQMAVRLESRRSETDQEEEIHAAPFATTIFVDYTHLLNHDVDLCEAIDAEMVRFDPFLPQAVQQFMLHSANSILLSIETLHNRLFCRFAQCPLSIGGAGFENG